ncbi:oxysterol-binding protein-related protein 2 [Suricata suricatta]|uniref:oxysterol-binding protein-related protein 2 n=1 Tax=Suricata suricatta TaxID=37032 RepID=UPI001155B4CA|nr:oxysterol-binding protein-related protein 2 [Suricata suricatta]
MNGEEEFFDAVTGFDSENSSGQFPEANPRVAAAMCVDAGTSHGARKAGERSPQENGVQKHRTALPAPMFTRSDFSVWSILKKCIGLELSKITMPIAFNEPLSFLQRITEYMEHVYLIHRASCQPQALERMQCVAAFAVSAVASQWERTGKPFNPLLGETYELIRVCGESRLEDSMSSVFRKRDGDAAPGTGLEGTELLWASVWATPALRDAAPAPASPDISHRASEARVYLSRRTGDKCVLHFKPCGLFGKELHKVEGHIQDKNKKKLFIIYGKWTECLWGIEPAAYESFKKRERRGDHPDKPQPDDSPQKADGDAADAVPEAQETVQAIPGSKLLWRVNTRPPNSAQMYNFTSFTVSLNELQSGMEKTLAPTDCRLRPDIRGMENGDMGCCRPVTGASGPLGARPASQKLTVPAAAKASVGEDVETSDSCTVGGNRKRGSRCGRQL